MARNLTGSCLCGAIRFTVAGPVKPPMACHCRECQRHSGNYWVAITAPRSATQIRGEVGWVSLSERARRGFCPGCGGFLFWEPAGGDTINIAFGNLDEPGDLRLAEHTWCEEARLPLPDDGTPHHPRDRPGADG